MHPHTRECVFVRAVRPSAMWQLLLTALAMGACASCRGAKSEEQTAAPTLEHIDASLRRVVHLFPGPVQDRRILVCELLVGGGYLDGDQFWFAEWVWADDDGSKDHVIKTVSNVRKGSGHQWMCEAEIDLDDDDGQVGFTADGFIRHINRGDILLMRVVENKSNAESDWMAVAPDVLKRLMRDLGR